jgi:two-component system cell cycle sensor histidine kinase/response regulator CckA
MNVRLKQSRFSWPLVATIMLLVVGLTVAGWAMYRAQRNWVVDVSRRATLNSTGNRAEDVRTWRGIRFAEANALLSNREFVDLSIRLLKPNPTPEVRNAWNQVIAIVLTHPDYQGAALLDDKGQIRQSLGDIEEHALRQADPYALQASRSGRVQLSDPWPGSDGSPRMSLVIPLSSDAFGSPKRPPAIALVLDPRKGLSVAVRGRNMPGSTVETVLLRREQGSVTVLDAPGIAGSPAVGMRLSVDAGGPSVARVVQGLDGAFDGPNFRGIPSLGAIHRVGDTEWWIVSSLPRITIMTQVRSQAWNLGAMAGLMIVATASILMYAWQRRQSGLFRRLYEAEASREVLVESFDHLTRFANDIIVLADGQERIIEANERALEAYGYTRDEFLGLSLRSLRAPALPNDGSTDLEILKTKGYFDYQAQHIRKKGDTFPAEVRAHYYERGGRGFFHCIIRDISERIMMERRLTDSAETYRKLFEGANDAIVLADAVTGQILDVNEKVLKLTGCSLEQLRGQHHTILHPADKDQKSRRNFRARAQEDRFETMETEIQHVSGRRIPVEVNASRIELQGRPAVLGVFRDLTERRQAEEDLHSSEVRRQKLESLALLAGGIAHDFNNLLTATLGNISLARHGLPAGSETQICLEEAERASLRAKDLTQQLLTFSKGGAPIKKVVDVGLLLRETVAFACRGTQVKIDIQGSESSVTAEVDEGQIAQVINNISINAVHAMPAGGTLTATVRLVTLDTENPQNLPPGPYARLALADTGTGISPQLLQRVFDPYFTTKQQGSGLGLAVSHSIVDRHGGFIGVKSRLGAGTEFEVLLPASPDLPTEPVRAEPPFPARGGRVLVMDDEEQVRDLALRMVARLGFKGKGARDGTEALHAYREAQIAGMPFDAVIMDLTIIGGMGGKETVAALLAYDPGARVIASSGYSNDPIMSRYQEFGFQAILTKPYRISEMRSALAVLLGTQPDSAVT